MRWIIALILVVFITSFGNAQRRITWRTLNKANTYFERENYKEALKYYTKYYEVKNDQEVAIKIAECNHKLSKWKAAELWYSKIVNFKNISPHHLLNYAQILGKAGKCDLSKMWDEKYRLLNRNVLYAPVSYCQNDEKSILLTDSITIHSLSINSKNDEYSPFLLNEELVFTLDKEEEG